MHPLCSSAVKRTLLILSLSAVLLAGCGDDENDTDDTGAPAETSETSETTSAVSSEDSDLLTEADVPTGWTKAENAAFPYGEGCDLPSVGDNYEEVAFQTEGRILMQVMDRPDDLDARWAEVESYAERCASVAEGEVTRTVTPIEFPNLGDRTYALRLEAEGVPGYPPFISNAVYVQKGDALTAVSVLALSESPDRTVVEDIVTAAVEKL